MTYVLMTRPEEDCQAMAGQLLAPMVCEPLLIIHPRLRTLALDPLISDLIITSSRVLDIIENIQDYRTMPIWCVGDVTAELAKEKGFETIHVAHRSAQELLEKIVQENPRDKSFFVHLRGDVVHVDITSALNHVGFHAESILVYDTQASSGFSPHVKNLFEDQLIGLVPFYSQRTAEIFVDLVKKTFNEEQIPSLFSNCHSLAHSEAIAEKLQELPWKSVEVIFDLGVRQIDAIYLQYYGKREEGVTQKQNQVNSEGVKERTAPFVSPVRNRPQRPASSQLRSQILLIGGVSLFASIVGVLMGLFGTFMFSPFSDKREDLSRLQAETLKDFENRLSGYEHKLEGAQRAIGEKTEEQTMQASPASEMTLSELKEDVSQIKKELGLVVDRLVKLEESSVAKKQTSPVHEPSPDYQGLMIYQRLLRCQHSLLVSEVTTEDQQFLLTLGIPAQDLWSTPQLLAHLETLELGYGTVQSTETEGVMGQVMRKLDIKVQHKTNVSFKESIISDLRKGKFTFLDPKTLTSEIVSQLSPEGSQWLDKARQTAQVKEQIDSRIAANLVQTPLTPIKAPVHEDPTVTSDHQSSEDPSIIMETPAVPPVITPENLPVGQDQ